MFGRKHVALGAIGTCLWVLAGLPAQSPPRPTSPSAVPSEGEGKAAKGEADPVQKRLADLQESLGFVESGLTKKVEDLMLFRRLEDVAMVDKVRYTGLPPRVVKNPTGQGAGNPIIIQAYTFLPRKFLSQGKLPLVILVHGGVHGDFNGNNVHVLRELL